MTLRLNNNKIRVEKSGQRRKDGTYLWRAFNASLRSILSIYYPCQRPSRKQKVHSKGSELKKKKILKGDHLQGMDKVQLNSQKMTKQPWASYCKKQKPTRNQTARDPQGQSIQSHSQVTKWNGKGRVDPEGYREYPAQSQYQWGQLNVFAGNYGIISINSERLILWLCMTGEGTWWIWGNPPRSTLNKLNER